MFFLNKLYFDKILVLVLSFTYMALDIFIQFLLLYLEHVNI